MCLTESGKKVLPHVHELARVMETIREAAREDGEPAGELRVACGETLLAYKMPQVLQRFKQRAPQVRLSLQSLNCYVIRDALLNDSADLGVFYRVGNDDALTMTSFGQQSLTLVASPQHPAVDFTRCGQHIPLSFVINEPQCVFRQIFESTLRQRAITWKILLSSGVSKVLSSAWRAILASAICRVSPLRKSLSAVRWLNSRSAIFHSLLTRYAPITPVK